MKGYNYIDTIYSNALATPYDVKNWRMEGDGAVSFPMQRMRLEGTRDPGEGQNANLVFWCPDIFQDNISISWDFYPIREPGLCILFFAAAGKQGKDMFSPEVESRNGPYSQYHHGDINALHISYFRRKFPQERAFTTCNLRKSYGFHLVAQGSDPIPSIQDAQSPYQIEVVKYGARVMFGIGNAANKKEMQTLLTWEDDGTSTGPLLSGGRIGFRQMVPLIAEYANLNVRSVQME